MTQAIDLRVVELLAARLCHDLIGPVSAISNGAELLADEEPEFAREAAALVGDSAKKALRNLQFYRFTYAFGGDCDAALPHLEEAIRLSPRDALLVLWPLGMGWAAFTAGRDEEAIEFAMRAAETNPEFRRVLFQCGHALDAIPREMR